jgi:drug/metabolite transporter (DMT)-like permease
VYNKRVIPLALALSLAAAGLHATWNVLLKTTGDPLRTVARAVGVAVVVTSPVAALAWLLSGRPGLPPQAWLLVGLSGFAELAYLNFLSVAYRCGDLSVVYPLARGTAPLLAVPAGLVILRERLSPLELVGVACLLAGIWAARRPVAAGPAVRPALLTGVCIATYSTIDRVGVRLAPPWLSWLYGWVLWIDIAVLLAAWLWLGRRQAAVRIAGRRLGAPAVRSAPGAQGAPDMDGAPSWARILAIGLLMMLSYFLVLVALRFAPLTLVAPLRESAIVLVTGWGIWRLKERQGLWLRLGGATSIVLGMILLAL